MSLFKLISMVAMFSLMLIGNASADPWGRPYPRYYRPYGPSVYAYPPVVVAPPPIIVSPYPAAPVFAAPPPVVYGPPGYGVVRVGPRGRVRYGYTGPGFGVFIR